jgi:teichuronic acid exporter
MTADTTKPAPRMRPPSGGMRSLVQSVAWIAAAKWTGQILTFGITILVARILSPEDYGLVGMGWMFLGLVRLLSEFAIGASIVIMHEVDRERLARLNGFAILWGLAGCAVTAASAYPLGMFFSAPDLPPLVLVLSTTFIISSFRTVPLAVLQRDLRFRTIAILDLMQTVIGATATLMLAMLGARYWALVLGNAFALLVGTSAAMLLRPQRLARPRVSPGDRAISISRNVVISNLGWYTYSNADFLIVGRVLGQASLGLYTFGWTLALAIVERVTTVISGVMPAFLAVNKENILRLRQYFFFISEGIALVTFPVSIGLALVADDFCAVVLGPQWLDAVTPLRLLALYAAVRSLAPLVAQILTVLGHDGYVARNSVMAAIGMPIAFYVGVQYGMEGVAFAWVFAYPFIAIPLFRRAFVAMEVNAADYFRALTPAFIASAAMLAGVFGLRFVTPSLTAPWRLVCEVAFGGAVYTAVLLIGFRDRLRLVVDQIRGSRSLAAEGPAA